MFFRQKVRMMFMFFKLKCKDDFPTLTYDSDLDVAGDRRHTPGPWSLA